MNYKELKIVVVCGGISSEREISLQSGAAIFRALQKSGYRNLQLFDLTRENISELLRMQVDLAFLALHGKGGEDGCIQGALELAGIPYTGSSVEASAICMNKIRTKEILLQAKLPTPRFVTLKQKDPMSGQERVDFLLQQIGLPMVLKAPREGSSFGVVIVKEKDALLAAMQEVFHYCDCLLAEQWISGIELTLPILGNDDPLALPPVEITSKHEFFDYEAKYTHGLCQHIIPAGISEALQNRIMQIGIEAYQALGCSGLARIDFLVDAQEQPMILEVNTLPGMTEMSLFPDSARYAHISFEELVDRIVRLAFSKGVETGK